MWVYYGHAQTGTEGDIIDYGTATQEQKDNSIRTTPQETINAWIRHDGARFTNQTGQTKDARPKSINQCPDFGRWGGTPELTEQQVELIQQALTRPTTKEAYELEESIDNEEDHHWTNYTMIKITLKNGKTVTVDPDCPPYRVALAVGYPDRDVWIKSMRKELEQQWEFDTLHIMPRDFAIDRRQVLKSGWRLLIKRDRHGAILKAKSRAYCCGYSQQPGRDFTDVSCPTLRAQSFRMLIANAVEHDLCLMSGDVSVAFLHSLMDRELYMDVYDRADFLCPHLVPGPKRVARVNKGVYGTRQAGLLFYKKLSGFLIEHGFSQSYGDRCLFQRAMKDGKVIRDYDINSKTPGVELIQLGCYVDDLAGACTSKDVWAKFVKEVQTEFQLRDEGELTDFLGCQIDRQPNGSIKLSQPRKCDKIGDAAGLRQEDGRR